MFLISLLSDLGVHQFNDFSNGGLQAKSLSDLGQYLYGKFGPDAGSNDDRKAMRGCGWVGSSITSPEFEMLSVEDGLIPTETRIKLRVAKHHCKLRFHSTAQNVTSRA